MKTIQEQKTEYTLNKVFRYEEGIMSRKEWLKLQLSKGATVQMVNRRNYAAEDKLNEWLFSHRDMLSGNPNWPPTIEWRKEEARLKAGIYKTEYRLNLTGNSFYDITKAEYDYFNNVLLAEQIKSEQLDIPNRIEAGIATEEQIAEYMQPDIDFFNKYCK